MAIQQNRMTSEFLLYNHIPAGISLCIGNYAGNTQVANFSFISLVRLSKTCQVLVNSLYISVHTLAESIYRHRNDFKPGTLWGAT